MKASVPPAAFALLLCVIAIVPLALADPIPITLFNTGVGTDGNLVPDGGVDRHYSLIASDDRDFSGPEAYTLEDSSQYPFAGWWVPNSSTVKWIAPDADNLAPFSVGYYTYRTTFYLPNSYNPKKDAASIIGLWAVDNSGPDILINGLSTGNPNPYSCYGEPCSFNSLRPFSITTGFDKGLNVLDFLVWNEGGPTGLRVEMTGTYDLKPIPEPSTLALLGIGLAGLIGCGWRRGR